MPAYNKDGNAITDKVRRALTTYSRVQANKLQLERAQITLERQLEGLSQKERGQYDRATGAVIDQRRGNTFKAEHLYDSKHQ